MLKLFRSNPYRELEKNIGYSFRDKSLIATAVRHRSFKTEADDEADDNERMEFLGDSALNLIVGLWLYQSYPDLQEGALTTMRTQMTSGKALARLARHIKLGDQIKLGRGERKSGGHKRASTLEDALEAIIGAAFLDGGLRAVNRIFHQLFIPLLPVSPDDKWADNPKGRLQDVCQRRWRANPRYRIANVNGPAHSKTFVIEAVAPDGTVGFGDAFTKHEAESRAAQDLLDQIQPRRRERSQAEAEDDDYEEDYEEDD